MEDPKTSDKQLLNRFRNAIHNEAEITKQDIRDMVEKAVEHLVDKRVKQLLPDQIAMDRLIDKAIQSRVSAWYKKPTGFNENIEKRVATELSKKIKINVESK